MIGNTILTEGGANLIIVDKILCSGSHYNYFVHGKEFLGVTSITKYLCKGEDGNLCLIEPSDVIKIINQN